MHKQENKISQTTKKNYSQKEHRKKMKRDYKTPTDQFERQLLKTKVKRIKGWDRKNPQKDTKSV